MTRLMEEILKLSPAERISLIGEIWDSLEERSPSEAQRLTLKNRLDDYRKNPENVVSWEETKASLKR